MNRDNHCNHSLMVRHWKAKQVGDLYDRTKIRVEGKCHKLRSPHSGYLIQVSFTEVEGEPDVMIVRSTNWRTEHEPRGVYSRDDARAFYRMLKQNGFVEAN